MISDIIRPRGTEKPPGTIPQEKPLQSWKEIAAYLERDERTARRWEKEEGLPVRRHCEDKRSSVYAYPGELDAWRLARGPKSSRRPVLRWSVPAVLGFLVVILGAWFIKYSPIFNPPNPLVEAADGITLRQVWSEPPVDDMGDVSLDGRFLTFTDWDTGDLAIRDLETEETRRVTDKGTWRESDEFAEFSIISSDGKRIAYSWHNEEGNYDLRVSGLDGSDPEVLYRCSGEEWVKPIDWLPDGSKILVGLFQDSILVRLAFVSASDHSVDSVAESIWKRSFVFVGLSPDGESIVFDDVADKGADQRDIYLLPITGESAVKLVQHPADDYMPVWSPDGRNVLFASDRTGSIGLWKIPVREGKVRGEPELVKREIGPLSTFIGCTKAGDLYLSLNSGMEDIYFFELDPVSGKVVKQPAKLEGRYVGANMGPVFSPDGKYVAYHFQHAPHLISPGALATVVRSIETGAEREIRTRFIQWGPVQWFPDGESVLVPVMRSPQQHDQFDYYQMDLGTGQTEMIRQSTPKKSASYRPSLSPDGKSIYFTESETEGPRRGLTIFRELDLETGQEEVIHRLPEGRRAVSVQLSPDGQNLAWAQMTKTEDTSHWSVMIRPVDGDSSREILKLDDPEYLSMAFGIAWAPDGKHILVSKFIGSGRRTELLRLSLKEGKPQSLGISMDRIHLGDVHKNGRLVAFYAGQQKGRAREIWALNGFLSKNEDSK